MRLTQTLLELAFDFSHDQLLCVFEWAGEEGAGGLLVTAAAELGGDLAHVKPPPASQRASDSPVLEFDEKSGRRDHAGMLKSASVHCLLGFL